MYRCWRLAWQLKRERPSWPASRRSDPKWGIPLTRQNATKPQSPGGYTKVPANMPPHLQPATLGSHKSVAGTVNTHTYHADHFQSGTTIHRSRARPSSSFTSDTTITNTIKHHLRQARPSPSFTSGRARPSPSFTLGTTITIIYVSLCLHIRCAYCSRSPRWCVSSSCSLLEMCL